MNIIPGDQNSVLSQKLLSFDPADQQRIINALELARDYSTAAASILLDLGMDPDTIIAALIRQLPESSSSVTSMDKFGPVVAALIRGTQKIDSLKTYNETIYEAQNIRNMIFALTDDIRVLFIKLAEKLASLRALDSSEGDERKITARECLDIYAPLADRLGISWIKNEMEDLSLKFLNRETYQQIKNLVAEKRGERNRFLEHIRETLRSEAEEAGIEVDVESRAKHFYSVYMKMRKRGISAEKIYDLSGIRVICNSIENCYTLLGIVHRLWRPVSGCFNDYIANPKPNGYQSLHTTVTIEEEPDEEGRTLEIQIRTKEMHQIAEQGVASHWLYKKGSSRDMVQSEDIGIVNKLKDWKQSRQGTDELSPSWLDGIKKEILRKWIYVFTPQGKVIKLPAGATPIDFAYYIHTAVGEHCMGAKANDAIIPLSSPLKNTQVVEIITSQSAHPHFNWLELAKSTKARAKIRAWLDRNDDSVNSEKTPEAKKKPVPEAPAALPVSETDGQIQKVFQPTTSVLQVLVDDEKNMMIRYAHCCNPVAGDPIIGYVSRGRGIIIHRKDCASIIRNPEFEKRKIRVDWENAGSVLIKRFRIEAKYSANL
ncbi:MAG: HD domain-containing protein, partial [Treponema sp.]|nr:HD domain-containing protein [Treponema sp.]